MVAVEIIAALHIKQRTVNELIYRAYRKLRIKAVRHQEEPKANHRVNGRGRGHRDWVEKREALKDWFDQHFPTPTRRREGYLLACEHMVDGWLSRTRTAQAKRSAESFVTRPDAVRRRPSKLKTKLLPEDMLTTVELETCQLLTEGKTAREIGSKLGVNHGTIKKRIFKASEKVGSVNRVELALWFAAKYPSRESLAEAIVTADRRAKEQQHNHLTRSRVQAQIITSLGK
jgi:DNA-binding CsgD family transcriptional regulator